MYTMVLSGMVSEIVLNDNNKDKAEEAAMDTLARVEAESKKSKKR